MQKLWVLFLYAVLILAIAQEARAQNVCSLPLTNIIEVLDSRLTVRVPVHATTVPRQRSIMSAPESSQEETRIEVKSGGSSMVIMVRETFTTSGPDFEKAIRTTLRDDPLSIEPFASKPPLRGYAYYPSSPHGMKELIWGAYMAQSDGTVELIEFYGDHLQGKLWDQCTTQAKEIASSLAPGTRRLKLDGGTVKLGPVSNDWDLFATVPSQYVSTMQNGEDFIVYKVKKIVPMGSRQPMLGIYIGNAPSFDANGNKTGTVTLLGQETDWYDFAKGNRIGTNALVKLISHSEGWPEYAHIFANCSTAAELSELKQIAGTLSIKPHGKANR